MRYDLTDLQLFSAIAQCGSLSQAAERVHLAPASASARIRHLEEAAGSTLFERHPRGLSLTRAGEAMQRHARQVLAEVTALDTELAALAEPTGCVVRLAANTNAICGNLPDDLTAFIAAHPWVELQIEEMPSATIARAVSDGAADIGILADGIGSTELAFLPYRSDPLVLICPPHHRLAKKRSVQFADTLDENFISLGADSPTHALLCEQAREAGRPVRIRAQLRSFSAVCRMVATGIGIALVPRSVVAATGQAAELAQRPLAESWADRGMKLCFRRDADTPAAQQELLAFLTLASAGPDQRR